ncbi:MAG TPA: hypothetical protein VEO54_08185 [Thermoanaerobaculia bacterium]|nr:hypothetical protein [Thermoanaerobaculia bacterium]
MLRTAVALATCLCATTLFSQNRTPNSIKYRDSGIAAAKGQAGDATIEVRALINRDLTTDIEVTTDSGSISRVQVKVAGTTQNFNALDAGSTFSVTVDPIGRGVPVEVQAHVDTGTRTEVVTATAVAGFRPDLGVVSIAPPPHALIGFPARTIATVREHNGEFGARADCRLLADGVEIDRAEGIWVDAADQVDCRFTHVFQTAGVVNLQVVVDNVNPGDWDTANNSATAQLTVYDPKLFNGWTATAREEDFYDYNYSKNPWAESTREEQGYRQTLTFSGAIGRTISLEDMHLSTRVETDGVTIYDVADMEFDGRAQSPFYTCRYSRFGAVTADVCQSPWDPDLTNVDIRYSGSEVTFHSWGTNTMEAPSNPGLVYDYTTYSNTNPTRFGSTVAFDVIVSDGVEAYHAQPFISSLTASRTQFDSPYRCFYSGFWDATICSEVHRRAEVRSGSVSGR